MGLKRSTLAKHTASRFFSASIFKIPRNGGRQLEVSMDGCVACGVIVLLKPIAVCGTVSRM